MPRLTMTAALEVWRDAAHDLGRDLGGLSLTDLLADNFPESSITECSRVAEQLRKDLPNGPVIADGPHGASTHVELTPQCPVCRRSVAALFPWGKGYVCAECSQKPVPEPSGLYDVGEGPANA